MWDVIVAGGGPVGLFLAAELRLAGASVVVLERLERPDPDKDEGDRGVQARTLQTLRLRGLLDAVLRRAGAAEGPVFADFAGPPGDDAPGDLRTLAEQWTAQRLKGHLAFLPLLDEDGGLADVPAQAAVWQGRLERVLEERALALGAEVRRGRQVTDVRDDGGGVVATLAGGEQVRAAYLVGCDGGHSQVRRVCGFDFPGADAAMLALLGTAELADPDALTPGIHRTGGGLLFVEPPPGQIVTVEFGVPQPDRRTPVTREEFEASLRRVSGADVEVIRLSKATRVTDHARQVSAYRRGRVLLAGDAAHVHSPMGGQGLNLGLQDAANLGWKLGLVAAGLVPETLLDSYTAERHPIGATVLRNTKAQTALLRPDPHSSALRELVAEIIEHPQTKRHLVEMLSGIGLRVPHTGSHPLAGRFVPVALDGTDGLGDLLAQGRGLLLDLTRDGAAGAEAAGWRDRVNVSRLRPDGLDDHPQALLVRPDGYVAWGADGADPAGLRAALTRWFGPALT
ncbi:FAD-dependent monooxygenase [Nonomuraea rosea]|uniref:FAD-dependent monooxygenase n=1 Tax=Nonomuraea rosea TaxID=638574 RepID=A0ABP6Z3D1_9ACTN